MREYKVQKAEWADAKHKSLVLEVAVFEDGMSVDFFTYAARQGDNSEALNQFLWDLAMEKPEIPETEYLRTITGKIPPQPGFKVVDGEIVAIEDEKLAATMHIDQQLNELYSGRALALAERDPVYAKNRTALIDELLTLEKQPNFPENLKQLGSLESL